MEIEKIKGKLNNQVKNMEIVFQYLDEPLKKSIWRTHSEQELVSCQIPCRFFCTRALIGL